MARRISLLPPQGRLPPDGRLYERPTAGEMLSRRGLGPGVRSGAGLFLPAIPANQTPALSYTLWANRFRLVISEGAGRLLIVWARVRVGGPRTRGNGVVDRRDVRA